MGGKNAQTTFSEFCLSMKQTPATLCPALRVLIDWILELSILAPSQLIVMWESGGLGQNAPSFVVVALKAETGCDLFFFFARTPSLNFRTKLANAENEGEECENPFRILPLNETQSCNQNSCPGNQVKHISFLHNCQAILIPSKRQFGKSIGFIRKM